MKKIMILAVLLVSSFLSLNAQDVILMKDNTIVTSVVKEIGDDYLIYKAFDNQAGPDYRISLSKVQKIKYANGKEETFSEPSASPIDQPAAKPADPAKDAQVLDGFSAPREDQPWNMQPEGDLGLGTMEKDGSHLYLDRRELSDAEVRRIIGQQLYDETYDGAKTQIKVGKTLFFAGLGAFAAGLIGMISLADEPYYDYECADCYIDYGYEDDAAYFLSAAAILAGAACMDAGIPLWTIGSSRMRWIANDYNERSAAAPRRAQLDFGLQQHGFGLALKF